MDTRKLIRLIQERECLWNQKNPEYHSREVQKVYWNEVAEELNFKVQEAKTKWRSLRDNFRREHKRATTPGDSGEEYIPKWPYYKIMFFVKDATTSKPLIGSTDHTTISSVPSEADEDSAEELETKPLHPAIENESRTVSQIPSARIKRPATSRRIFKTPLKHTLKRPRNVSNFDNKLLQIEEEKLKCFKGNMRQDSEMLFLMSLHPFLKQISPSRQLAVRSDIMRALMCDDPLYSTDSRLPNQSADDEW